MKDEATVGLGSWTQRLVVFRFFSFLSSALVVASSPLLSLTSISSSLSRSLSLSQDWIKDPSISPDSFLPSSNTHNPSSSNGPASSAGGGQSGLTPAARQALTKKFIVQPADTSLSCPICKEGFKAEYSDDEEEWIWKNAVEEEGIVSGLFFLSSSLHFGSLVDNH